ncbi:MAG: MBL fold metallo-hydrolase, partial [Planctomycetota bacterium]
HEGIMDRARAAIISGSSGPLANDLPYTRHTGTQLERLAALEPRVLATMHGSAFAGDGGTALRELSLFLRDLHGGGS